MTENMDLAIKPGGIIFLWTVSALLVLLLVVGIFSNRVRQYFYAHPKVEFWVGGTYFVCPFLCWSNTWIGGGLLLSPWYFLSFSNFFYGKISGKTNLVRDCFGLCDDVAKMRIRNLNKLRTVSTLLNDKIPGVLLRISGIIFILRQIRARIC